MYFPWTFPSMKRKILIFPSYDSLLNNCSEIKALPHVFLVSLCPNLLIQVTSITKWSLLFFPKTILPPAFLLCCIVWPVVLICLFCLFFAVLAQSLMLLALPCCALYLSMLYLLIIWITLSGSWPYFLHYRFKFFLPSIFSLISLLCTACSFLAIIKVLLQSSFYKPLTICHHLFMSCSCCSSSFTSGFASLVAPSN